MKGAFALLALPLLAQQGVNFYTVEKERALGQRLASEIRRESEPLDNPVVDAYAKRIGSQIVAHLTERPFDYSFEVISAAEITEPIPLPGGYILIPAGFFVAAKDEAEFAGMLAHSIGHIALRHGTRMATRGQVVNLASVPLVFMGGWVGGGHADCRRSRLAIPLGFLKFQQTHELEADAFGLQLAARAGYDAAAFRRYIERTQTADCNMSHLPAREPRLETIDELLRSLPVVPSPSTNEFQRIQEVVRNAVPHLKQRPAPTLRR